MKNGLSSGVLGLVILAGCGGATGQDASGSSGTAVGGLGSSGTGATSGIVAVAQTFATSYCATFAPCCADAGSPTLGQGCGYAITGFLISTGYSEATLQACLAAIQSAAAKPGFCDSYDTSSGPCANLLSGPPGTAGPGQQCVSSGDCIAPDAGSALCDIEEVEPDAGGSASTGTCMQTLRAGPGQPCGGTQFGSVRAAAREGPNPLPTFAPFTDIVCWNSDGLWCDPKTYTCVPLGGDGADCQVDDDCVAADYCSQSLKCASRAADGAACPNAMDLIGSGGCLTTSYCDTASMTCKPTLPSGSACSVDAECASDNCTNGTCQSSVSLFTCGIKPRRRSVVRRECREPPERPH